MSDERFDYLIVGAGMAGDAAAKGIRELDEHGTIALVGREPTEPVTRPALSKKLWTDPDFPFDDVWLGTVEQTGAELVLGEEVVRVDLDAQEVTTDRGRVMGFGRLLVATGGTPAGLPIDDWHDSGLVVPFRTVSDYRRLRETLTPGSRAVVVGGSYIATEMAAALVQQGVHTTLVHREQGLLSQVFPATLVERVERAFTTHGVTLAGGCEVTGGSVHGPDGPVAVELSDGRTLEADVVVAGLGISLETDAVAAAGVIVADDGGVVVDEHLRSSCPHVWAAGDVAQYPDAILGRRRVEHVDHAQESGRAAGRSMAGADEAYTHTPYYYSVLFDDGYEAVGTLDASLVLVEDWQGEDDPTDRGVVYYTETVETSEAVETSDGAPAGQVHVRGVLLWNVDDARDAAREVLAGGPVDPHDLVGRIG